MKTIVSIALSMAFLSVGVAYGKDSPKSNPLHEVLTAVPSAELPAKAADLVLHASPRDRQAVTINVLKGAVGINPAAAPAIVGAIARAVPDMAPVAAGTAAVEQPKQASAIAKAAAAAAPAKAGKIVVAVCRAVPNEYRNIAVAVSQAAPGSGTEIVNAVASALPDLKPGIERVLAGNGGKVSSVASAIDQAAKVSSTSTASPSGAPPSLNSPLPSVAPMARGPSIAPPYVPLLVTPTNVASGSSGEVPTGGRNYASP